MLPLRRVNNTNNPRSPSNGGPSPGESRQRLKLNESNDQIKGRIRDCILRFEPAIFACKRPPSVEGAISFLEDMDEGIGGPDSFRAWLQTVLDASVRSTVEAEVQQQCKNTRLTPEKMKMVAPAILSKVLETIEMKGCQSHVEKLTSEAVSNMLDNFERELVLIQQLRGRENSSKRRENNLDSLDSSTGSSFSVMHSGLFARVSEQLHPYMGPESRMEALNLLMSSQLCDVVGSAEWPSIKEGLACALIDTQTNQMSALAIKIHARIIGNMSPFCTKEAFVNIVETLTKLYKDKSRLAMLPLQGSDVGLKKRSHHNVFHMFKFVVCVAKDLPRFWIRYPESYVTEIVKSMLELICINETKQNRGPSPYTPLELMAITDPRGSWVQSWLHAKFGRSIFFSDVRSCLALLKASLQVITNSLENFKNSQLLTARGSGRGKGLVSTQMICYANFSHSLTLATLLMQYKRELTGVNFESVIVSWMSFISSFNTKPTQSVNHLLVNSIRKLVSREHLVSVICRNKTFIKTIVEPLIHLDDDFKLKLKDHANVRKNSTIANSSDTLQNILSILLQVLENPKGLKNFTSLKIELKKGLNPSDFILHSLSKALTNFDSTSKVAISVLLDCCLKLLNDSKTVLSKVMPSLVEAMSEVFNELDYQTSHTPTNNYLTHLSQAEEQDKKDILEKIGLVLVKLSSSPAGVLLSSESCVLDNILKNQSNRLSDQSRMTSFLQNIAWTAKGQIIIQELKVLDELFEKLQENPAIHDRVSKAAFSFPSPDEIEESSSFILQQISCLVSNFQTAKNAVHSAQLRPIFTLHPNAFHVNVPNNDFSFILQILLAACSSLDTFCFLQHTESILGQVQTLKAEFQESFELPVIDKESMYYDYLVAFCGSIGGEGEKYLPTLDFIPEDIVNEKTDQSFTNKDCLRSFNQTDDELCQENLKAFVENTLTMEPSGFTTQTLKDLLNRLRVRNNESALFSNRRQEEGIGGSGEKFIGAQCAIDLFMKYQPSTTQSSLDLVANFYQSMTRETIQPQFDWLGAIVLAVFDNDTVNSLNFLNYFFHTPTSEFMWPKQGGNISMLKLTHLIEVIMIEELPDVYYAIVANGIALTTIINRWWGQVFLNYLSWTEICNFIAFGLTHGPDHIVYFYVGLFKHLRNDIMKFTVGSSHRDPERLLVLFFLANPIKNFKLGRNLEFILKLRNIYPLKPLMR